MFPSPSGKGSPSRRLRSGQALSLQRTEGQDKGSRLRQDLECYVAAQRGGGGDDLDVSGGCAGGDGCGDFGGRNDGEGRGYASEGDAGRAGEIVTEDDDGAADLAGIHHGLDEWRDAERDAIDSLASGSIEVSVGGLQ